jgi:O-antigen ligase
MQTITPESDCLDLEFAEASHQPGVASSSVFARYGLSSLDVLLCFGAFAAMCAYTPFFFSWHSAPRMVIVLVAVLPGLMALGWLARVGDRPAQLAVAFLAWAVVSAAFSDNVGLSLRGTVIQNSSVLTYAAAFGLWALAHFMSGAGRKLMLGTVMVGVGLNAAVGAAQVVFQLEDRNLGLSGGRALGLTPNPIELAALMLVGIFVCLAFVSPVESRRWLRPAAFGLFAFGAVLAFTSTRIALLAFVIVAIGDTVRTRSAQRMIGAALAAGGVIVGTALSRLFQLGSDPLSRAGSVDAGGREDWWVAGWHAFAERPILGWGVGRFRSAIQGELSFEHVALSADSQAIPDAHNIVVGMVVALGIPGLVLLACFAAAVSRRASGVYSLALIAVPMIWLLQPIAQTTLILYMTLLGIAVTTRAENRPTLAGLPNSVKPGVWVTAVLLGIGAASWVMVAEYRLSQAALALDGAAFESAAGMYLGDPILSDVGATIWIGRLTFDDDAADRIVAQMERTVELEPTRSYWHARLGLGLAQQEDWEGAVAAANRALELQPTSIQAWSTLLYVAEQTGDQELYGPAMNAVCRLELDSCVGDRPAE